MKTRNIALCITALIVSVALFLLADRGGLIAWVVSIVGIALLAKVWLRPSRFDLAYGVGLAIVSTTVWFGALYYVISTYESGEVVELVIDTEKGAHTARLWVFEIGESPMVYYDADPEVVHSLLAGKPLQFTREGTVSTRIPKTTQVDALPESEANQVLEAMGAKYGDRMLAADVSYLVLGIPRDRVAVIVRLIEEQGY